LPISAADLLRAVPGVFVNTALGEIRNIVYSRGISANSNEAGAGYYYVSLQEDGLPVTNVTAGNYGPDYFYRQDLGLERLEALRGGTATVTGPNAPGGIFNYISKTGKSDPGLEFRVRSGLQG
jgi:outer membrane receptor protein involved in Fe transport